METQKSTRQSANPWANLPQEIITEVFLRLPVKSLLKFRCLSKSWHATISSPLFRKTHLEISTRNNMYSHKNFIFGSEYPPPTVFYTCSLYPKGDKDHSMDPVSFDYPDFEMRIVGSCNGLICVDLVPYDVVLWNPATRKYRELPGSGVTMFSTRTYGFGYDVFNDDYKGAVHWRVYYSDLWGDWDVIAQNLTTQTCSSVALPVPRIDSGVDVMLGVSRGCLCAFHDRGSYMDIWVLKEYGVQESWNIMVSFPYSFLMWPPRRIRPKILFVWENGGILLHLGSNLIMYKQSQYHETYPLVDDNIDVEATTYIESFVSPDFDHMWS